MEETVIELLSEVDEDGRKHVVACCHFTALQRLKTSNLFCFKIDKKNKQECLSVKDLPSL